MREVSVWLDAHCSRGDRGVFRSAAELRDAGVSDEVYPVSSGDELLELGVSLASAEGSPVDHLVIAGHGGTTWILDDRHGATTRAPTHAHQVGVYELAKAWAPVLSDRCLVSLAACMCSRSPRWYLRAMGRLGSDWGPRAYKPGGQASFSARLRDALIWYGASHPRVRGHRASGHATALALLAQHGFPAASPCTSLFALACPGERPTLRMRRRWVRVVTGELAQRWLLGDDSVVAAISHRM